MATLGQTLFRFSGALLLGATATAIDDPGALFAPTATVPVLVAAKDLPRGVIVDRSAVVVARWPAGTVPARAYASVDSVANRVTAIPIFKGEAIVPGRLAPEGTGAGLDIRITPGKRAISFPINDVSGIAGLIQPNSRVDVLVVIDGDPGVDRVAKLFLENMRVLAIGQLAGRSEDGRAIYTAVATLEVTPDEGERLAVARSQGELQLMLRGYSDPDSAAVSRVRRAGSHGLATACDPPTGQVVVRDLLQRTCPSAQRESPQIQVVPPR